MTGWSKKQPHILRTFSIAIWMFSQFKAPHLTPKFEIRKSCWELCHSQRGWK